MITRHILCVYMNVCASDENEYLSMKHLLYGRLQDYTNEIHWENHDTI